MNEGVKHEFEKLDEVEKSKKRRFMKETYDNAEECLNHDTKELVRKYKRWLDEELYLKFNIEKRDPESFELRGKKELYLPGLKRGNKVYKKRVEGRVRSIQEGIKDHKEFNPKDRSSTHKTHLMYIVLTYDPKDKSRFECWKDIGKKVNKFKSELRRWLLDKHISGMKGKEPGLKERKILEDRNVKEIKEVIENLECLEKLPCNSRDVDYRRLLEAEREGKDRKTLKRYLAGKEIDHVLSTVRSWENFNKDSKAYGYPHVNLVVLSHLFELETFYYKNKWRIKGKKEIGEMWEEGYVDIQALSCLKGDVKRGNSKMSVSHVTKYITKDLTKGQDGRERSYLLNAILWIMKKRSFSLSGEFREFYCDDLTKGCIIKTKSFQTYLSGSKKEVIKVEFRGLFLKLEKPPPDSSENMARLEEFSEIKKNWKEKIMKFIGSEMVMEEDVVEKFGENMLKNLKKNGELFSPRPGYVKKL